MGIFSIFLLPIIVFLAVMIYKALKQDGLSFSKRVGITFLFLLPFTYDIVITNILGAYYCLVAPPHPKTKIIKKVEYPISIYWEDNVYPGFSKEDRELMIINYLDGKHLKIMALNGDDGKIYAYHLDKYIWKRFKQEFKEKYGKNPKKIPPNKENHFLGSVYNVYDAYADEIMKTEKIYTKQTMPKTNYTVTFNEIPLNFLSKHFLYSDETKVIENNTSKVIAYNRRYMRFFYNIFPEFEVGNLYYYSEPVCGSNISIDNWAFGYVEKNSDNKSQITDRVLYGTTSLTSKNRFLYKKYIKGEK